MENPWEVLREGYPKTNIAPKNGDFHLGISFSRGLSSGGRAVNSQECTFFF